MDCLKQSPDSSVGSSYSGTNGGILNGHNSLHNNNNNSNNNNNNNSTATTSAIEIAIKREHQHWSLPMLGSGGDLNGSLGMSSSGTSTANSSALSNAMSLDAYATSSILANSDELFTKTKTPKLELQTASFFGEMSPTANPGSVLNNSGAVNDSSPASSSSSAAMVAAAAAFMQVANGNGGGINIHQSCREMSNGLGGRAHSFSMGGSDGGSSVIGGVLGSARSAAGGTTPGGTTGVEAMQPRQRRKVPEGELCAVCSDRATGYHYGVASCNGCKTFFRRTIVSEHTFVCQYQGNCDVNKNVRCACRHCRFNKCVAVGMDARAIQNDRDRIGPTKKFRLSMMGSSNLPAGSSGVLSAFGGSIQTPGSKRTGSMDEDQLSMGSLSPSGGGVGGGLVGGGGVIGVGDTSVIEKLMAVEELANKLRNCVLEECKSVRQTLMAPSLLYNVSDLTVDEHTLYKELYPASMNDIQMWNIRELRLCLEWAKTFETFTKLSENDQFYLVRNVAFSFNLLNRVFYSIDHGPDRIVFPNGAFILRQPQEQVRIPGCRSIYHRQMDEIMLPFRRMNVTTAEFATFKAILLFNPNACDLSVKVKEDIARERSKYLQALFYLIVNNNGMAAGLKKYGDMLMMAPSIQNIIDQNDENMQVMEVFGNFWRINGFVKELCMK